MDNQDCPGYGQECKIEDMGGNVCGPIVCPPLQKENSNIAATPVTDKVVEDSVSIECEEGFIFKDLLAKTTTATCVETDKVATWVTPGSGGSEQNSTACCVPGNMVMQGRNFTYSSVIEVN